jgi:protein subunit release factor A
MRKAQLGVGARGDKRRTVRMQDEQVNDHVTGRRWRLKDYLRGDW